MFLLKSGRENLLVLVIFTSVQNHVNVLYQKVELTRPRHVLCNLPHPSRFAHSHVALEGYTYVPAYMLTARTPTCSSQGRGDPTPTCPRPGSLHPPVLASIIAIKYMIQQSYTCICEYDYECEIVNMFIAIRGNVEFTEQNYNI